MNTYPEKLPENCFEKFEKILRLDLDTVFMRFARSEQYQEMCEEIKATQKPLTIVKLLKGNKARKQLDGTVSIGFISGAE